jgi:hypothetical protein
MATSLGSGASARCRESHGGDGLLRWLSRRRDDVAEVGSYGGGGGVL